MSPNHVDPRVQVVLLPVLVDGVSTSIRMRRSEDPELVARLFCWEHGIVGDSSETRVTEALRGLLAPSPAPVPPTSTEHGHIAHEEQCGPTVNSACGSSEGPSRGAMGDSPEGADQNVPEYLLEEGVRRAIAAHARSRPRQSPIRYSAVVGERQPGEPRAPSLQRELFGARVNGDDIPAYPKGERQVGEEEVQSRQQRRKSLHRTAGNASGAANGHQGKLDSNYDEQQDGVTVAEGGRMASAIDVKEVAASMRLRASQDLERPGSVLVDLLVNGSPAPLVFHPRHDDLSTELYEHWPAGDTEGAGVGAGVPGAAGRANASRATGWKSEAGGREKQSVMVRRRQVQEPRENEEDVLEIQIRRAAEAWCRAFGSNREDHLSFVRGEIRKAWDSSKGNRRQRSRRSRSVESSSLARGSGLRGDGGSGDENRLTPSSILAPDVEKGTDVFWVQWVIWKAFCMGFLMKKGGFFVLRNCMIIFMVDPTLPKLHVTAGSSALEISEKWCREHDRGPFEIPLVAWKVLEAYPQQMKTVRNGDYQLPFARSTLADALIRHGHLEATALLLVVGWIMRRRFYRKGSPSRSPTACRSKSSSGGVLSIPFFRRLARRRSHARPLRWAVETRETKSNVAARRATPRSTPNGTKDVGVQTDAISPTSVTQGFMGTLFPFFSRGLGWAGSIEASRTGGKRRQKDMEDGSMHAVPRATPKSVADDAPATRAAKRNSRWIFDQEGLGASSNERGPSSEQSVSRHGLGGQPQAVNMEGCQTRLDPVHPSGDKTAAGAVEGATVDEGSAEGRRSGNTLESSETVSSPESTTSAAEDYNDGSPQRRRDSSEKEIGDVGKESKQDSPTRTWQSVLEKLTTDPCYRFSQAAIVSTAGRILWKTDAFAFETHEGCDLTRLMRNKKGYMSVAGAKYIITNRGEGAVMAATKEPFCQKVVVVYKSTSARIILGTYSNLSRDDARMCAEWLEGALAAAGPIS